MDPPPQPYLRALGALISTTNTAHRLQHVNRLISLLPPKPSQAVLTLSLTTQAVSQLFTTDHIAHSTQPWSRHPSHTEPLLEALLTLLSTVFSPSQPPVPHATQRATPPANPFEGASNTLTLATAHLLHLLTTLATEQSIPISRLSHRTLAALVRLLPPDTTAAFLPGLVSSLSKILSRATDLHSTVCIAALDALTAVLATLDSPPAEANHKSDNPHPLDHPPTPGKPRLSVLRDEAWIQTAAHQSSPRLVHVLTTSSGPLHHSSPRAREHLSLFLSARLRASNPSDASYRAISRTALVSLAGDDFPYVRDTALHVLTRLLQEQKIALQDVQYGVRAIVSARGYTATRWGENHRLQHISVLEEDTLQKLVASGDSLWMRVAIGYLNVLIPPRAPFATYQGMRADKLAASLAIVGPDAFCRMLTELLSEQWAVPEDTPTGFSTALDCLVLRASESVGNAGLLTSVFSTLIERAQLQESDGSDESGLVAFKERGYAVLVLHAVLRGEIGREDVRDSKVHQQLVYECTKETLQVMNGFFLPATERLISGRVDDDMISMKHCLLICTARLFEDLADMHRKAGIRPLGADITLVMLMALLRDVANGEMSVRKTAKETMVRISKAIGWKSERKLLFRHLNYIIGRVIRNLEKKWSGDILNLVIGTDGDATSREATVLLENTLKRMNENLAGADDESAITTMNAIINVLSTAIAQKEAIEQHGTGRRVSRFLGRAAEEAKYQNDLSDLRKTLFDYCKEDIPNYDQLTAKVDIVDRSFLDDDEKDEDANVGAFETVAIHALEGTRDILVGRPWNVCAASLQCATLSVKLLEGRRRTLLPFAAKILPLLPDQFIVLNEDLSSGDRMLRDFRRRKFGDLASGNNVEDLVSFLNSKGQELPVVTNACLLLAAFATYAGSFIRDRFVRLIYPKLRPLLRLAQCFPTLLVPAHAIKSTNMVTTPSYGAMSACDACLQAITSIALVAPDVLAPFASSLIEFLVVFFDPKYDPATSPKRLVVHTNRSMVRFECERWIKRSELAETIVRQLKIVNANDVLMALLRYDGTAPDEIKAVHESLHPFPVQRDVPKTKSNILRI